MNTPDQALHWHLNAGVATDPPARVPAMDAVRGLAVCGIVLLNVYNFAMPPAAYFNPLAYGGTGPLPLAIWALESIFAQDAFRAIFAMLFGAGSAILFDRAGKAPFRAHYARMLALLAIGILHALLLANGDVLRLYALVGLLLPPFLRLSQRGLLIAVALLTAIHLIGFGLGAGLLLLQWWHAHGAITTLPLAILEAEFGAPSAAIEWGLAMGRETLAERIARMAGLWQDHLMILGLFAPQTLAAMLLGVWGWRGGLLQGRWPASRSRALAAACALGSVPVLGLLCWAAFASGFAGPVVGTTALVWSQLFAILLGLAYTAALFARWGGKALPAGLGARLAAAGRLSLTSYIGASILAAALYAQWGLALFAATDRVETTLIALAIIALILALSPWWLSRFGMGPFERLWRGMAQLLTGR